MMRTRSVKPEARSLRVQVGAGLLGGCLGLAAVVATAGDPHQNAAQGSLEAYLQRGLQAAMQTRAALGSSLMQAIDSAGTDGAVAFCNTRAAPIAQEVSAELGAEVTRVSDRPRNPGNVASDDERAVIARFKEVLAGGGQPAPEVREEGEHVVGYYPIVTNGMCLQCHGVEGTDISAVTQRVIDALYPDDQATGYLVNDLRGLFVVSMRRD